MAVIDSLFVRSMRSLLPNGFPSLLMKTAKQLFFRSASGLAALTLACVAARAAELRLGETTTPPGTVVSVPVTCVGSSGAVGAQFDITFNPSAVSWAGLAPGAGLGGHVVDQEPLGDGLRRVLVYSLTNALIAPGAVVWVSFAVPTNAPDGVVPLALSGSIMAQVSGKRVQPLEETDGAVTVWSGGSFLALTRESGDQMRILFQGIEGRRYVFEASTNLVQWVVLETNTVTGGTTSYLESDMSLYPHRFYRTRLVQ